MTCRARLLGLKSCLHTALFPSAVMLICLLAALGIQADVGLGEARLGFSHRFVQHLSLISAAQHHQRRWSLTLLLKHKGQGGQIAAVPPLSFPSLSTLLSIVLLKTSAVLFPFWINVGFILVEEGAFQDTLVAQIAELEMLASGFVFVFGAMKCTVAGLPAG